MRKNKPTKKNNATKPDTIESREQTLSELVLRDRDMASRALIATLARLHGLDKDDDLAVDYLRAGVVTLDTLPAAIAAFTQRVTQPQVTALVPRSPNPWNNPWNASAEPNVEPTSGEEIAPFDRLVDHEAAKIDLHRTLTAIGHELGIDSQMSQGEGAVGDAAAILFEIRRLTGAHREPGPDPGGDSDPPSDETLADVIAHNANARAELERQLKNARTQFNRIASAMQVDQWNKDGDEILAAAQKWSTFKYTLKRQLATVGGRNPEVRTQLSYLLAMLVSSKTLADWLAQHPAIASHPVAAVDVAAAAEFHGSVRAHATADSVATLRSYERNVVVEIAGDDGRSAALAIEKNPRARQALADLINLIVLPLVHVSPTPVAD